MRKDAQAKRASVVLSWVQLSIGLVAEPSISSYNNRCTRSSWLTLRVPIASPLCIWDECKIKISITGGPLGDADWPVPTSLEPIELTGLFSSDLSFL